MEENDLIAKALMELASSLAADEMEDEEAEHEGMSPKEIVEHELDEIREIVDDAGEEIKHEFDEIREVVSKEWNPNPWAVCHSQKLEGDKFERCVKDIKKKQSSMIDRIASDYSKS